MKMFVLSRSCSRISVRHAVATQTMQKSSSTLQRTIELVIDHGKCLRFLKVFIILVLFFAMLHGKVNIKPVTSDQRFVVVVVWFLAEVLIY